MAAFRGSSGLVKVGGNWYRVIGVLDRESSRASDVAGENANANPGKEVYLPITQTFGADNVRRQGLVEAWLAIDPVAALRLER